MHPHDFILLISGTNRPHSCTLRVARRVEQLYHESHVRAELYNLENLPIEMFEPEAYKNKPPALVEIQRKVLDAGGLHVVLPEYNGSFPGVLKYFIDLLKFPESLENKPVAYVGESSGLWGGLRSVEQLKMAFGYRHAHSDPVGVSLPARHTMFGRHW